MSYSTTQNTNHLVFVKDHVLAMLSDTITLASKRLHQRKVYRTTLNELSALSDRELADIGTHRSEIYRIAKNASLES